jgi:2-polyprenyl-6-methoxyphenol hydroxylase-like FAD-dependent oxidoreductase
VDNHAVVIGAGIAGLAAARVLSDRFATVTVVDRDALPAQPTPRRGVPQGAQPHILLVSGLQELTRFFPGFDDELLAAGGTAIDLGSDLCIFRYGRRWPQVPCGFSVVSVSRPQLEALVRARVTRLAGVTIRDRVAVSGLAGADGTVTGVVLDTGETVDADLVVDCSGRGARSDRWLEALGRPTPEQIEIKVGVGYSTRVYQRRDGDLPGWRAAFTLPESPAEKATGLALPVEGDRWLITLGGWHTEPPAGADDFEAAARTLPDPIVAGLMDRATPLSDVVVHRFPSSRRRLFEKLDRLPAGYVALGDAVCSFNPVYGQGMTCAAREAAALGTALDHHDRTSFAKHYYAAVAEIIAVPWGFVVGSDFGYPETTGPRPRGIKARNWFSRRIAYASQVDAEINRTFIGVQQLLIPPSVLTSPRFILRVLRQARRRTRALPPRPSPGAKTRLRPR